MTIKDSFAAADWGRVVAAPMLAGIAVTAAEPSGLFGALRESMAAAGALRTGTSDDNPLIREVIAAYDTAEGRDLARGVLKAQAAGKKPAEIVEAAVDELKSVAAVVTGTAPDQAAGFKAWLNTIAGRVAEAGTEGGFLGFGGEKVSAHEKATLERIATAIA
ncbi:MAG: hypothetical protein U1E59_02750 [Amaricoccus sp.]